ncbi:MAG: S8 family serine peptidase, partial [Blastocatellia bacterium]
MKNPKLRSHLLVCLMFIAAWLPVSLVRAWSENRSNPSLAELLAQGGVSGDIQVAPEPDLSQFPAEQLARWWDRPVAGPDDPVEVMVELEDASAIDAYLQAQPDGASFDKQSAPQAIEAAQAQLARVERAQQKLAAKLTGSEFNARITGQVQRVFNGVGVQVAAGRLREIRRLPGVKAVHILKPMYLTTETSVPFIGAPQVWQGGSGIPGATGEGAKVAILDTGVDYIHVNFGGSGNAADYAANNPTVIGDVPGFPGLKVVGGHDFVGNAYNAASNDPNLRIPRPDPDPMDCYGHGTGTASILAGFGVTANGATYTGPYNLTTHSNQFRVGPGVAPKATIYSFKVYGCDPRGGTNG